MVRRTSRQCELLTLYTWYAQAQHDALPVCTDVQAATLRSAKGLGRVEGWSL
jgi:hypothetical protein